MVFLIKYCNVHDLSGGCRGLSLCGLACELNHSHFRAVFKGLSKNKTKATTPTNHNTNKQRHEPITVPSNYTCNLLEAQEKSRVQGAIGCGFASH